MSDSAVFPVAIMNEAIRLRSDVSLAPLNEGCAPRMYAWMRDPDVNANIGLRSEPSLAKTQEWIAHAAVDPTVCAFAIHVGKTHVGNVVLDQIDRYLSKARFSIYLGDITSRGQAVASTATYLILKTAFDQQRLYKVWLTVHARNAAAIIAYTKRGFQLEGILRGEHILKGERLPAWYMSILADEFKAFSASFDL